MVSTNKPASVAAHPANRDIFLPRVVSAAIEPRFDPTGCHPWVLQCDMMNLTIKKWDDRECEAVRLEAETVVGVRYRLRKVRYGCEGTRCGTAQAG